ncbi:MAG: hypothetical protein EOO09_20975 [Chitinophagaceae bacterium]|nr:MAG: hypothetical protein EOO09_20975 [Chitinophagaceae bacterium]
MKLLLPFAFMACWQIANAQAGKDSLPQAESRDLVFDSLDLKIIQRADSILTDTSRWHKNDDRVCNDDITNGKYSLFCALFKASVDLTGVYQHRRPGMQQVRFVLEKYENGRVKEHRLMDWNNHPDTGFDEVKKVLRESILLVKTQIGKAKSP